jgi:hypothetical protein
MCSPLNHTLRVCRLKMVCTTKENHTDMVMQGALQKCDREKRKSITADDLIWTLKTSSDFSHYAGVVRTYTQRYRAAEATMRLYKRQDGTFCS